MNCKKMNLPPPAARPHGDRPRRTAGLHGRRERRGEKTIAEKMVGRWNIEGYYEKLNGEWVLMPDETACGGWYHFHSDGMLAGYRYYGEIKESGWMTWKMDEATGDLCIFSESGQPFPVKAILENDDRFYFYYTTGTNPVTGETREGEFKEVLVREKK